MNWNKQLIDPTRTVLQEGEEVTMFVFACLEEGVIMRTLSGKMEHQTEAHLFMKRLDKYLPDQIQPFVDEALGQGATSAFVFAARGVQRGKEQSFLEALEDAMEREDLTFGSKCVHIALMQRWEQSAPLAQHVFH